MTDPHQRCLFCMVLLICMTCPFITFETVCRDIRFINDKLIYHSSFRMERHYELYREGDFRSQLREILSYMLDAYCSGCTTAVVYTHSIKLFNYIECWSRGWYRRAGPGEVWKDSKGKFLSKIYF